MDYGNTVRCDDCGGQLTSPQRTCTLCGRQWGSTLDLCTLFAESPLPKGYWAASRRYSITGLGRRGLWGYIYPGFDHNLERRIILEEFFPPGSKRVDGYTLLPWETQDSINSFHERFMRYVQVLACFNHPAIPKVYNMFSEKGTHYIVREYLPGRTLKHIRLRRGWRLPPCKALAIITETTRAVLHMHKRKYIHGNLNPRTILWHPRRKAGLTGFAFVQRFGGDLHDPTLFFNPGYTPISHFKSPDLSSAYIDLYALGAILYTLITGKRPSPKTQNIEKEPLFPAEDWCACDEGIRRLIALAMIEPLPQRRDPLTNWYRSLKSWYRDASPKLCRCK